MMNYAFQDLLSSPHFGELRQLRAEIVREGCFRDPIDVWILRKRNRINDQLRLGNSANAAEAKLVQFELIKSMADRIARKIGSKLLDYIDGRLIESYRGRSPYTVRESGHDTMTPENSSSSNRFVCLTSRFLIVSDCGCESQAGSLRYLSAGKRLC